MIKTEVLLFLLFHVRDLSCAFKTWKYSTGIIYIKFVNVELELTECSQLMLQSRGIYWSNNILSLVVTPKTQPRDTVKMQTRDYIPLTTTITKCFI